MRPRFQIHLASILLEPNRWKPGRVPSIRASDWSEPAAAAGFDGWELFENHHLLVTAAEREALRNGPLPVRVFNSYAAFDAAGASARDAARQAAIGLGATAMKFNVGRVPAQLPEYRSAIESFMAVPPERLRLWCECHPDTWFEDPQQVADFVAGSTPGPFDVIIHPFLFGPEQILRWSRLLGSRIRHAHVQMRARRDSSVFLQLADDAPRAQECLAALAEAGFDGAFTIEFAAPTGGPHDIPDRLFSAAVRDLEFLREHWRPRGASAGADGNQSSP